MNRIKEILKEQGRSQMWLARQLNVHPTMVNHWTANRRKVPQKYESKIANLLGIPVEILFPE